MNRLRVATALTVVAGPLLVTMMVTTPANASPQIGGCTSSYDLYTIDQLAFDPAAQAIFPVIDSNGDEVICFKLYPKGDHNGRFGNLVDNKAAPHT